MAFKFADLMISYVPSSSDDNMNAAANYVCHITLPCLNPFSFCPWSLPIIENSFSPDLFANELPILKQQLQQSLLQFQIQEAALNTSMSPQTVAEAQALEEKMVSALEELRKQKEELQKKAEAEQG